MDLAGYRSYVRNYMDLTAADIADDLFDEWVAAGQRRVLKARPRWPHLETKDEIKLTVEGGRDYALANVRRIEAVDNAEQGPIAVMDHAEAKALYWTGSELRSGRPEAVSQHAGVLWVWPTPDGDYTLEVIGQRAAITPTASGDEPDLPEDLHDVVLEWVMQEAYLQQDDPEMASARKSLFNEKLSEFVRDEVLGDDARPMIFGGGPVQRRRTSGHLSHPRGPGLGQFGDF